MKKNLKSPENHRSSSRCLCNWIEFVWDGEEGQWKHSHWCFWRLVKSPSQWGSVLCWVVGVLSSASKKWVLERRHGTQTIKQIVLDSKCPALSHPPCLAWKGRNIWELSSALSVLIIIVSIWPLRTHWVKIKILSISKITPQNLNEILWGTFRTICLHEFYVISKGHKQGSKLSHGMWAPMSNKSYKGKIKIWTQGKSPICILLEKSRTSIQVRWSSAYIDLL